MRILHCIEQREQEGIWMRTCALALTGCLLGILILVASAADAQPFGIGVKIPLQAFVFVGVGGNLAVEIGLPIGLSVGGLAAVADLKLFLGTYEVINLLWKPFAGVGASATVQSQGELIIIAAAFQGVLGIEVPISQTSLSLFFEAWVFAGGQLPGIFGLGSRYDF